MCSTIGYSLLVHVTDARDQIGSGAIHIGLLDGKVRRIMEVIDSSCKQQDVPKVVVPVGASLIPVSHPDAVPVGTSHDLVSHWQSDAVPVETSHNPVSQPVPRTPAGKGPKRGRGSWVPPNIISPK